MGCVTLAADPRAAIAFAARLPYVHSLCIGLRNLQEVLENLRLLEETDGPQAGTSVMT
jgi:aryl-alcohol dehydrogenase-like predicted oxidoreductase